MDHTVIHSYYFSLNNTKLFFVFVCLFLWHPNCYFLPSLICLTFSSIISKLIGFNLTGLPDVYFLPAMLHTLLLFSQKLLLQVVKIIITLREIVLYLLLRYICPCLRFFDKLHIRFI